MGLLRMKYRVGKSMEGGRQELWRGIRVGGRELFIGNLGRMRGGDGLRGGVGGEGMGGGDIDIELLF